MRLPASLSRMRRRLNPWGTTTKGRKSSLEDLDHPAAPPICVKENTHLFENDTISILEDVVPLKEMVEQPSSAPVPEPVSSPMTEVDEVEAKAARASRRRRRVEEHGRVPRLSGRSRIIRETGELRGALGAVPVRQRGRDLQLIYSSSDDGVSLGTLYTALGRHGGDGVLLLVRDTGGAVFGAYTSVPYQARMGERYGGSGECFVFSVRPTAAVYKWKRSNNYFQLCRGDSLALGGGGDFALHLDSMLETGTSGACDTFGSPCLASAPVFQVVVVECYALVVPSRLVSDREDS